jgi:hypothetical protein
MNPQARTAQAAVHVERIQIPLRECAKASLTAICCIGSEIVPTSITFAAADGPENVCVKLAESPFPRYSAFCEFMPSENSTPPMTIARDVARFLTSPRVAVADAVSFGATWAWSAMRGG